MNRRPPRSTRPDTRFPYATLFRSALTFPDDALGGPCAQHTASELPNGNILIFDNGSADATRDMCVDPQDRANGTQRRASTRITEYALDEERGAASLISSYDEGGFALFAGGVVQSSEERRGGKECVSTFRSRWSA